MALSQADEALIADMKQRELHLKSMERAADAVLYRTRRYRAVLIAAATLVGAAAGAGLFLLVNIGVEDPVGWQRRIVLDMILGAIIGSLLAQRLLRTRFGERLIARQEARLVQRYATELHAGRRWRHFYYRGEDISGFVPQVLHFLDGEHRFDSIDEALAFAREHRHNGDPFASRALAKFNEVAGETNLLVVSSTDGAGGPPASQVMRFAKADRPGVWYVTTAPEGLQSRDLLQGEVAVLAASVHSGSTISSNSVRIRRLPSGFPAVIELYRTQVPGYVDRLTEDDQQREVVYELTLDSAEVDTWLEHDVVDFGALGLR